MVRGFQAADLGRVAQIWLETNIKAHHFIPAQYWQEHFSLVREMLLQAELYVYEGAGEVQGFIGLQGGYIAGIFVCGGAQSKGIGKQLLDAAKRIRPRLELSVYKKNARAAAFYQREGFQILCEGTDPDTGEAECRMAWGAE